MWLKSKWLVRTKFDLYLSLTKVFFVQFAGDPLIVPSKFSNRTLISIRFASPTLTTEQEELAYSFQALIADLGGLLGLFVGFNFLMIWDCVLHALKFLKTKPHMDFTI